VIKDQPPARFDLIIKRCDGAFRIGCVLNDAETKDDVEHLRLERRRQNVCLRNSVSFALRAAFLICFDRFTEIDRSNHGALLKQDLGKTSRAAACFQNLFVLETSPGFTEATRQPVFRDGQTGMRVELSQPVFLPLRAEGGGIIFRRDEAGNAVSALIAASIVTRQSIARIFQRDLMFGAMPGLIVPTHRMISKCEVEDSISLGSDVSVFRNIRLYKSSIRASCASQENFCLTTSRPRAPIARARSGSRNNSMMRVANFS
jgi:hypothetical protein